MIQITKKFNQQYGSREFKERMKQVFTIISNKQNFLV